MKRSFILFLNFSLLILLTVMGCENNQGRKIKVASLSSNQPNVSQTASSVLQVSLEQQRTIAILYFENETRDQSLDWLRRGLNDMLFTELSQSPYLNVIPMQRLTEIIEQKGKTEEEFNNRVFATYVAREAKAEILLTGRFYYLTDSLCIEVEMIDAQTAQVIRREAVRGESLERIFAMVNTLSGRVRSNIRNDLEEIQADEANLTKMTSSLQAFRCYSLALENTDKFLMDEAQKCLRDAINYDSTFAAAHLRLARSQLDMGRQEEGLSYLKKARQYWDRLSEADKVHLQFLEASMKGDYTQLLPTLEEAVTRLPTEIDLRYFLARIYRSFGELDKALEQFEIAMELDPNRKLVYNDLGYLFADRGDFTTALKYLDKYRELAPDEPNPYDSKGEILMNAGKLDEAIVQLETALDKWPNFHYSAMRLAELYREFWDYDRAKAYIEHTKTALDNPKLSRGVDYQEALLYWRFGKIKEAEKVFKSILKEDPTSVFATLNLGEMYQSAGDTTKALQLYLTTFNSFKEKISLEKEKFHAFDGLADLVLRGDITPQEAIPVMEQVSNYISTPAQQAIWDFIKGLIYLRSGEVEKGWASLYNSTGDQFELISLTRYRGWSDFWKFIFEVLDYETPNMPEADRFYHRFSEFAQSKNRHDLEVIARYARAHFYGNYREQAEVADEYHRLGTPLETIWRIIGPFSTGGVSGFKNAYAPENEIKLDAAYSNANGTLKWQPADDNSFDGFVDLKSNFKDSNWSVGYGLVYIHSPDKRKVKIRLGCNEGNKLWFNDDLIWQRYYTKYKDAIVDRDMVTVVLRPGYNKVLLKVTNSTLDWGFYFRVTDENGNGFKDITFHSPEDIDQSFALR
jgi:Tfp pilus assembly protein PilF/TolB-like protein